MDDDANMNLDLASDNPFDDKDAFIDFLGMNEVSHQQICEFMQRKGLNPAEVSMHGDPTENETWLQDHYQQHLIEFNLLGLSDLPDLSVVDLSNKEQYLDWMQLHSAVHDLVNATLGITS